MRITRMRPATWLLIGLFAIGTLGIAVCSIPIMMGTGDVITQDMEFEDFDTVVISDAFLVQIRQGDEFSVKIEIDEASLAYLEVSQSAQQLKMGIRPQLDILGNFNSVHRAEITMPNLVGVSLDNASSLKGEIDTGDIWLSVDNASDVTLMGKGQDLVLRVDNASSVNLGNFAVQDAAITAGNASSAIVDVTGRLDAEVDNASSIAYYGDPMLGNTRTTIFSSITARHR